MIYLNDFDIVVFRNGEIAYYSDKFDYIFNSDGLKISKDVYTDDLKDFYEKDIYPDDYLIKAIYRPNMIEHLVDLNFKDIPCIFDIGRETTGTVFFDRSKQWIIHCDTIDKAKMLAIELDKLGYTWLCGDKLSSDLQYDVYDDETCYSLEFGTITYSPKVFYETDGDYCHIPITKFEDLYFEHTGSNLFEELVNGDKDFYVEFNNLDLVRPFIYELNSRGWHSYNDEYSILPLIEKIINNDERYRESAPERYKNGVVHRFAPKEKLGSSNFCDRGYYEDDGKTVYRVDELWSD